MPAMNTEERVVALERALRPLLDFWDGAYQLMRAEVDVADMTECAERLGLLALVPHAQPCDDDECACEGSADELYEQTPIIANARAALQAGTGGTQ